MSGLVRRGVRGGRHPALWAYGYSDLAALVGKTVNAVRLDVSAGKFRPGDLASVCEYVALYRPPSGRVDRRWLAGVKVRLLAEDPRCRYCRLHLTRGLATVEHLTPLSRGGTWAPENLGLSCARCNRDKGAMTDGEFRARRADPSFTPSEHAWAFG